jgi:hypothetical protein
VPTRAQELTDGALDDTPSLGAVADALLFSFGGHDCPPVELVQKALAVLAEEEEGAEIVAGASDGDITSCQIALGQLREAFAAGSAFTDKEADAQKEVLASVELRKATGLIEIAWWLFDLDEGLRLEGKDPLTLRQHTAVIFEQGIQSFADLLEDISEKGDLVAIGIKIKHTKVLWASIEEMRAHREQHQQWQQQQQGTERLPMPNADKFAASASTMVVGQPEEAAIGVAHALGLESAELAVLQDPDSAVRAIKQEFEALRNGDAAAQQALAEFEYICGGKAVEGKHPTMGADSRWDTGHEGMDLAAFVDQQEAKDATLAAAHVLALRAYTSSAHQFINSPSRKRTKPHPFRATVYYINQALGKLRSRKNQGSVRSLWRGMRDMRVAPGFAHDGGSELACMSTTTSREVAMSFAQSDNPLIFEIRVPSYMNCGGSISWLSVYPAEEEYLYPPFTYLQPRGSSMQNGIRVLLVEPHFPGT